MLAVAHLGKQLTLGVTQLFRSHFYLHLQQRLLLAALLNNLQPSRFETRLELDFEDE